MKTEILNCKELSERTLKSLKEKFDDRLKEKKRKAKFIMLLLTEDDASKAYINSKKRACDFLGIETETLVLDSSTTQEELENKIQELNKDKEVDALLVQMPLPHHIDSLRIFNKINPNKDVDGLNPYNLGKLMLGMEGFIPCTAKGIISLIKEYNIELEGASVVIIGRSNIVGKPLANLLINKGATVEICNSKTKNLKEIVKTKDIVISATGVKGLIKKDMLKENSIVLDVGISRVGNKLYGDADFNNILEDNKIKYITSVPGGIGLMTVTALMENIYRAYLIDNKD